MVDLNENGLIVIFAILAAIIIFILCGLKALLSLLIFREDKDKRLILKKIMHIILFSGLIGICLTIALSFLYFYGYYRILQIQPYIFWIIAVIPTIAIVEFIQLYRGMKNRLSLSRTLILTAVNNSLPLTFFFYLLFSVFSLHTTLLFLNPGDCIAAAPELQFKCLYSFQSVQRVNLSSFPLNEAMCKAVSDEQKKDDCYIALAERYKNSSLCDKMVKNGKEGCYQIVGVAKGDKN
jgi:hypothetical protein